MDKRPGGFFERAVTIHRYDCEAVAGALAGPAQEEGADGSAPGEMVGEEAMLRYALAVRPLFEGMRRAIGHVAGLLILAQAAPRRQILDLPDIAAARQKWLDLQDRIASLTAPRGLEPHLSSVRRAHALLGEVLDGFDAARQGRGWKRGMDRAADRIRSAYASLQTAAEPRAGMTMVDFNQACCSCAQRWHQEGGSNGRLFDLGS